MTAEDERDDGLLREALEGSHGGFGPVGGLGVVSEPVDHTDQRAPPGIVMVSE